MFIDTSGWLCTLDERDLRHERANELFLTARNLITHSYVIDELVSLCLRRKFSRARTIGFLDELFHDPTIEIVWVEEFLTLRAFALLKERNDKSWSLCDAVSFIIMQDRNLNEALTTDHHFEQAGFIKLLDS
jgi:predicted nucleic acid-binding protein